MINDITFVYPYVLTILLVYPLLLKFFKEKNQSFYFSNSKMLQRTVSTKNYYLSSIKFLIFSCLLIALASPVNKETKIVNDSRGYEISLIIDVSAGMRDDEKFNTTKKIVSQFIKKRENDRLALSVFADFAYVAVPLTYDKKSLLDILHYLKVGVAGYRDTALYEALYLGTDIFKNSVVKNKIAILVTDGLNTVDTVSLDTAIDKVKKYKIKVYTIAIGDEMKGNHDLELIAKQTNGHFYKATQVKELNEIYKDINILEKSNIQTNKYIQYRYYYSYLLYIGLFLLFLLLLEYRKKL